MFSPANAQAVRVASPANAQNEREHSGLFPVVTVFSTTEPAMSGSSAPKPAMSGGSAPEPTTSRGSALKPPKSNKKKKKKAQKQVQQVLEAGRSESIAETKTRTDVPTAPLPGCPEYLAVQPYLDLINYHIGGTGVDLWEGWDSEYIIYNVVVYRPMSSEPVFLVYDIIKFPDSPPLRFSDYYFLACHCVPRWQYKKNESDTEDNEIADALIADSLFPTLDLADSLLTEFLYEALAEIADSVLTEIAVAQAVADDLLAEALLADIAVANAVADDILAEALLVDVAVAHAATDDLLAEALLDVLTPDETPESPVASSHAPSVEPTTKQNLGEPTPTDAIPEKPNSGVLKPGVPNPGEPPIPNESKVALSTTWAKDPGRDLLSPVDCPETVNIASAELANSGLIEPGSTTTEETRSIASAHQTVPLLPRSGESPQLKPGVPPSINLEYLFSLSRTGIGWPVRLTFLFSTLANKSLPMTPLFW